MLFYSIQWPRTMPYLHQLGENILFNVSSRKRKYIIRKYTYCKVHLRSTHSLVFHTYYTQIKQNFNICYMYGDTEVLSQCFFRILSTYICIVSRMLLHEDIYKCKRIFITAAHQGVDKQNYTNYRRVVMSFIFISSKASQLHRESRWEEYLNYTKSHFRSMSS